VAVSDNLGGFLPDAAKRKTRSGWGAIHSLTGANPQFAHLTQDLEAHELQETAA